MQMKARLIETQMVQFAMIFLLIIGSLGYGLKDHPEKYIAETYFAKYDSLIDSEFSNFISNEIPLDLCEVLNDESCVMLTLSHLHRNISGEGSHRRLSSSVGLKLSAELKAKLIEHSCEVIIVERLPTGVFADPFELQHLVHRGVFTNAAVFGDTNLELPSFCSHRSVIEIHMSIPSKVLTRSEYEFEANVEVPLHARYQPLGHGFSRVEFKRPDLLIGCSPYRNEGEKKYVFMHENNVLGYSTSSVVWEIPCGMEEQARVVSAVTFGFAVLSTLSIALSSVLTTNSRFSTKLKSLVC